jgi:NDP-sugar pyrophosphorylase family protein
VRYSWEQPTVLGSAGGPRQALPLVGADRFFVVNGDTLTDVDLNAIAAAHDASGALVTLALVANREFDRYGGVLLDEERRVTGFVPRGPAAHGSYHYVGVQLADADAFAAVRPGEVARSIGGVYDSLMATRPGSVRGIISTAAFWDVGTVADYWRTSQAFAPAEGGRLAVSHIDPTAHVTDSILWDDVEIGARAIVDECIVTDGVRVPPDAHYRRAVVQRSTDTDTLMVSPLSF